VGEVSREWGLLRAKIQTRGGSQKERGQGGKVVSKSHQGEIKTKKKGREIWGPGGPSREKGPLPTSDGSWFQERQVEKQMYQRRDTKVTTQKKKDSKIQPQTPEGKGGPYPSRLCRL